MDLNGEMDGEGVLRMADGSKFKGQFKNGMKNGKCVEEDANGVRFEGYYENDLRNGAFVEKDKNGSIIRRGTYRRGKLE